MEKRESASTLENKALQQQSQDKFNKWFSGVRAIMWPYIEKHLSLPFPSSAEEEMTRRMEIRETLRKVYNDEKRKLSRKEEKLRRTPDDNK